jgi:hypothetical protein
MSVVGIVVLAIGVIVLAIAAGSSIGRRSRSRWDARVGGGESRAEGDMDAQFERPSNEGDLL